MEIIIIIIIIILFQILETIFFSFKKKGIRCLVLSIWKLTLVGSGGSYLLLLEEGTQGFCKQEENKSKEKEK
jgi:hypothetical protein